MSKSDHPAAALLDHAKSRDTLEFSEKILHGKMVFQAGEVVKFEDPAAAAYFDVAFNGTEFTTKSATRTVTDEDLNFDPEDPRGNETIDPNTVIGAGRNRVRAGTTVHEAAGGQPLKGDGSAELKVHDVQSTSGSEI